MWDFATPDTSRGDNVAHNKGLLSWNLESIIGAWPMRLHPYTGDSGLEMGKADSRAVVAFASAVTGRE